MSTHNFDRFSEPVERVRREPSEDELADYKEQEVERWIEKEQARRDRNNAADDLKHGPYK